MRLVRLAAVLRAEDGAGAQGGAKQRLAEADSGGSWRRSEAGEAAPLPHAPQPLTPTGPHGQPAGSESAQCGGSLARVGLSVSLRPRALVHDELKNSYEVPSPPTRHGPRPQRTAPGGRASRGRRRGLLRCGLRARPSWALRSRERSARDSCGRLRLTLRWCAEEFESWSRSGAMPVKTNILSSQPCDAAPKDVLYRLAESMFRPYGNE